MRKTRCRRRTFLVHGDRPRQEALQAALRGQGYREVSIPAHGETVAL